MPHLGSLQKNTQSIKVYSNIKFPISLSLPIMKKKLPFFNINWVKSVPVSICSTGLAWKIIHKCYIIKTQRQWKQIQTIPTSIVYHRGSGNIFTQYLLAQFIIEVVETYSDNTYQHSLTWRQSKQIQTIPNSIV